MDKYDGIAKLSAVVKPTVKENKKEKKRFGFFASFFIRFLCVAGIVAALFCGKAVPLKPLNQATDFIKRAICYDVFGTKDEELGYSEIAAYFTDEQDEA